MQSHVNVMIRQTAEIHKPLLNPGILIILLKRGPPQARKFFFQAPRSVMPWCQFMILWHEKDSTMSRASERTCELSFQTPRHQIDGMPHFTLFDHVHTIYESDSERGTHTALQQLHSGQS